MRARHASCLGATVVLDCVAMHGLTLASSSAGRKFISKTATLFESAKAEEAIAEIAGIGRIAVEDGVKNGLHADTKLVLTSNKNCYAENIALYPKLKEDLMIQEITNITATTKHGAQRLLERGFTAEDIIALKNHPDIIMFQNDGVK